MEGRIDSHIDFLKHLFHHLLSGLKTFVFKRSFASISKQNTGVCSLEFQPLVIWSLLNTPDVILTHLVISLLLRPLEKQFSWYG